METQYNKTFTLDGATHTLAQWAEIYGIEASLLHNRISHGLTFEEAINRPCEKRERLLTFKGETKSMSQWAKESGIPYSTLRSRLNNLHWTVEKALTTPAEGYYWDRTGGK